ncbi:MAG: DUF3291 domain-containing protein [Phenylobacterium sp.]
MSATYELAQVNIGRLKAPLDSPLIKEFVDNLDRINALADASPGFIWRLKGYGDNATDLSPYEDPLIIPNMSVWKDVAHLGAFVYRSGHIQIMRRRAEWFEHMENFQALWWVPAGYRPTVEEAKAKLELIAAKGPTAEAFTFWSPFPSPDQTQPADPVLDRCA